MGLAGVQLLNERVLEAMAAFNTVAPSHNPPYIAAIRQFQEALPNTPLVGSFETGFHAGMPPEAYLYSIPIEFRANTPSAAMASTAHHAEYVATKTAELMGKSDFKLYLLPSRRQRLALRGGQRKVYTPTLACRCNAASCTTTAAATSIRISRSI